MNLINYKVYNIDNDIIYILNKIRDLNITQVKCNKENYIIIIDTIYKYINISYIISYF
jgi:hypothetical protein